MNNELHIATAPLFFHTACVCSEKNYRLQDIQLSKSAERIQPHSASNSSSLARGPAFAAFGSSGATDPPLSPTCQFRSVASRTEASRDAKPPGAAKAGGEYRARTGDLLVANQALSQLS